MRLLKPLPFLVLFLLTACSTTSQKMADEALMVPDGWTENKTDNYTLLTAPENDLQVYYFKKNVDENTDYSALAKQLWTSVDPNFAFPELTSQEPPSEKWDRVVRIVYLAPTEQARSVVSSFKIIDKTAYVTLINGKNATLSKRGAQLSQSAASFRPKNLGEKDFSKKKMKSFATIEQEFSGFVEDTRKKLNVPGVAIGIIQDGKVVFNKGFGATKINGGTPVNENTRFMIGSVTKPLTTLMTAKMVNDKKLSWDDPLTRHLKGWKLNTPEATQSILMKHTACACTGMPRRDLDFIFEFENLTAEKRMREMATMGPTTKPGETFQYSNYLVAAGGYASASTYKAGVPLLEAYKAAMNDLVFEPLKMKDTLVINNYPYAENSAHSHSYDLDGNTVPIDPNLEASLNLVAPAGSVWSTTSDMMKYIMMELNQGKGIPGYINSEILLDRRAKNITISKHVDYGKGLIITDYNKLTVYGHDGNTLGQTALLDFIPERNFGLVILSNVQGANAFSNLISEKLYKLLFDDKDDTQKTLEFFLAEKAKGVKIVNELIKNDIGKKQQLTGRYNSEELGKMNITLKGNKLMADFGEFQSEIRELKDKGKSRAFVLASPPWQASVSLIQDKRNLVLEASQKKYVFSRVKN